MHEKMFAYVEELLRERDSEHRSTFPFPFRKRSDHIRRVWLWARRLLDCEDVPEDIGSEALLTAALFHDAGYALAEDASCHAQSSVEVFRAYAEGKGFDGCFMDFVSRLIALHSKKELMKASDTPMELILLMEADLLDETGALSIIWDAMAEGALPEQSFEKTYHHILRTVRRMESNPMVTPGARAIWERKRRLTLEFAEQLAYDLNIDPATDHEHARPEIRELHDDSTKSVVAEAILRQLPQWFGIEQATAWYIEKVRGKPLFAAFHGQEPVGFLSLKTNNPDTAEIFVMGVLEGYHRQGLGKELVIRAEAYARNRRCRFLMVKTLGESSSNDPYRRTRAFYRAMGFAPLEEIREIWDENNPCLIMVKTL